MNKNTAITLGPIKVGYKFPLKQDDDKIGSGVITRVDNGDYYADLTFDKDVENLNLNTAVDFFND